MEDARKDLILEKLAKLDGNAMAAHAAIRTLILLQPDPRAAMEAVSAELEKLLSIGLGKDVSDPLLEGVAQGRQTLLPTRRDLGLPS